jgi:hypothetical protein
MFAHKAYDAKLAQQASTRAEVLYYASHACETKAPPEMAQQLGAGASEGASKDPGQADTTGGKGGAVDNAAPKLRDSEQQGVSRGWNLAKSHRAGEVSNAAIEDRRVIRLSRRVSANSEVACNEKRFDNSWTGIFGFIKGFGQSGGGFID